MLVFETSCLLMSTIIILVSIVSKIIQYYIVTLQFSKFYFSHNYEGFRLKFKLKYNFLKDLLDTHVIKNKMLKPVLLTS